MSCEERALRRPFLFVAAICIALTLLCAPRLRAQSPHRDLYMYKGADRDQRVLQGAKKEGQVLVYTSLNLKDSVPIAEAFEKKYGVKLQLWRSSSEKVLQRALTEARAGHFAVDAFELNGPELEAMYREIVKWMGEDKGLAFFRRLSQMKPQIRTGHTLMAELVASGEIPLAATIYNHNAERLLVNGAPVKWKALTPTFGRPNGVAVARRAQRPHAALLFADFMLSLEGQKLIQKRNRVPASDKVDSNLNDFPYEMIDPVVVLDEAEKWERIWSELFLKGQAIKRESD